jgi:hypothetical protein
MQPFLMIRSEAQLGQEGFLAVIPYANNQLYPYLLGTTRPSTEAALIKLLVCTPAKFLESVFIVPVKVTCSVFPLPTAFCSFSTQPQIWQQAGLDFCIKPFQLSFKPLRPGEILSRHVVNQID